MTTAQMTVTDAIHRRRVAHEAGHAVAAVSQGAVLRAFVVPFDDFTGEAPDHPYVSYSIGGHCPLATYAGMWADVTYRMDTADEGMLFEDHMDLVADENDYPTGDTARLRDLGIDPCSPPADWLTELERLWPVIQQVTDHYIEHGSVMHDDVVAYLD